nr:hypothetical protein CFP56_54880 [Quercus suber]
MVAAAPFEKRWDGLGGHWWSSKGSASPDFDFGKRFPGRSSVAPSCDLSKAQLPTSKHLTAPFHYQPVLTTADYSLPTSASSSGGSQSVPRRRRSRNSELHVRPVELGRSTNRGRSRGNLVQLVLHGRQPTHPDIDPANHCRRPARPSHRGFVVANQPGRVRSPLLHRRDHPLLQPRHLLAFLRRGSLQENSRLASSCRGAQRCLRHRERRRPLATARPQDPFCRGFPAGLPRQHRRRSTPQDLCGKRGGLRSAVCRRILVLRIEHICRHFVSTAASALVRLSSFALNFRGSWHLKDGHGDGMVSGALMAFLFLGWA